jgi:hypothetical protein
MFLLLKMFEPRGVSWKTLGGNSTLLKLMKLNFIIDRMALFKTFWPYQFCKKNLFPKIILKNWTCFFISEIIWYLLKIMFRHLFLRWQMSHSSNSHFEVTRKFWTKTQNNKKCIKIMHLISLKSYFSCMHNCI